MFLVLSDLVDDSSSNTEGLKLFYALEKNINEKEIILVVNNEMALSSSFLNSSIGYFIESYGVEKFKHLIKVRGSKTQFGRILNYIEKFSSLYAC